MASTVVDLFTAIISHGGIYQERQDMNEGALLHIEAPCPRPPACQADTTPTVRIAPFLLRLL